jgi:hypothetical protein
MDLYEKQYSPDKDEQPSDGNSFQKYHDHMFFVSPLKILWEKIRSEYNSNRFSGEKAHRHRKDTVDLISAVW